MFGYSWWSSTRIRTPPKTTTAAVVVTITLAAVRTEGGLRRNRDVLRSIKLGRGGRDIGYVRSFALGHVDPGREGRGEERREGVLAPKSTACGWTGPAARCNEHEPSRVDSVSSSTATSRSGCCAIGSKRQRNVVGTDHGAGDEVLERTPTTIDQYRQEPGEARRDRKEEAEEA